MSLFISLIKALPFLLPFLKEVFMSDKEGKSRYCIRIWLIGLLSLFAIGVVGQSFYDYAFSLAAKNQELILRVDRLEADKNGLNKILEENRTNAFRQHNEYQALQGRYLELREDYKDLKFEYEKIFRRILKGKADLTLDEIKEIQKDHDDVSAAFSDENQRFQKDETERHNRETERSVHQEVKEKAEAEQLKELLGRPTPLPHSDGDKPKVSF